MEIIAITRDSGCWWSNGAVYLLCKWIRVQMVKGLNEVESTWADESLLEM